MLSTVCLYNCLMLGVDAAGLAWLFRRPSAKSWWTAMLAGGVVSTLLVDWLGQTSFQFVTLAVYGLFLHACPAFLISAILLRKAARKTALFSAAIGLIGLLVAGDAFWVEPTWLAVSRVTISSPKLARKVRLVLLADFQTNRIGAYERRVLETVLREKPDVILLAGDYLDTRPEQSDRVAREANALLKELDFRAPDGVFAIEGNVDFRRPWTRVFKGLPVLMLPYTLSIDVAGLRLTCLSVVDSYQTDLFLPNDEPERFHVVLGHIPNYAMGRIEADLLLAGHTHGGQVCLPGIGPLTNGCKAPLAWTSGVTELPSGAKLIVSRGTGMERGSAPEIRFCCRPELVVIDLVPE